MKKVFAAAFCALVWQSAPAFADPGDCIVAPMNFNSHVATVEGEMTVKAGKGCGFGLNGIQGGINEAVIVQKPKVGRAGVQGLTPFYVAKPGYQGADEFAYAINGTDQYGGPMRVTTKMKVTVVP
ncbi:hypothetical protein [Microvirga terricola]|uniref:Uncharacterized protein n=1 Tax=Microvirga terricola TaxID=2719797 RepID=A0ABX0V7E3_9HYPH|nr:hypothetical protein [Microvirga terricola]NIX75124.1 hypothetical protein [Microvirga terricola]